MLQGLGLVALLAACSCPQALGLQIIAGTTSSFTTLQSTEQLIVAVHPPSHRWDAGQAKAISKATPTLMRDKEGKQYLCYVPPAAHKDKDLANQMTAVKPEAPAPEAASPFGLLDRLSALCLYRVEGLWTYEVCYKKHTRQFRRPSANDKGEEFSCGQYTGDEAQSEEIKVDKASPEYAQLKYVSHNMTNGAPCALSGANRTSEVRFMCMRDVRDNMITSVREFPTCNYIFTVATPFLCKHPEFKPPEEVVRTLHCKHIQTEQPESERAGSTAAAAPALTANQAAEGTHAPEASSSSSSHHEAQGASQGDAEDAAATAQQWAAPHIGGQSAGERDGGTWSEQHPRDGEMSAGPVRHQEAGAAHWEAWPTDPGDEEFLIGDSRQAGYGGLEDKAVEVDGKETAQGVDEEGMDEGQEEEEAQSVTPARTHQEL